MLEPINISGKKSSYPPQEGIEFEPFDTYYKLAKTLWKSALSKYESDIIEKLVNDDDCLSNIATAMMIGDWKWNGKGNKIGYRIQCGKWMILTILSNYKKEQSKVKNISLNMSNYDNFLYSNMNKDTTFDSDINEHTTYLVENSGLTPQQKERVYSYYFEGMSYANIGRNSVPQVSRQAIYSTIKNAITKIKRKHNVTI